MLAAAARRAAGLSGPAGAPALALAALQLRRGISGLALRDESEVLGACGAEPYSESFAKNAAAMDDLIARLDAGEAQ